MNHHSSFPEGPTDSSLEQHLIRQVTGPYNRLLKRPVGLVMAVPLLVIVSPALLAISIAIAVDSGFPILYRGERAGLHGRPFRILKFRTMVKDAERLGGGTTALHDSRITRVGRLLRRAKLDELPQLVNIICGDMCFIGPRPELLQYTRLYAGSERYILEVRPGITDFSSIAYINLDHMVGSDDPDGVYEREVLARKNRLRVQYVEQMSPMTDLRLFVGTIARLAKSVSLLAMKQRVPSGND